MNLKRNKSFLLIYFGKSARTPITPNIPLLVKKNPG